VNQAKRSLRNPTEIVMRSQTSSKAETWRAAILSCDQNSNQNIVAQWVVTRVLNEHVQPIDEETAAYVQRHAFGEEIAGYIDLVWCPKNEVAKIYKTRFFVTSAHNPPYDAVLGRRDAERYLMF
jgi:hypothetical protein